MAKHDPPNPVPRNATLGQPPVTSPPRHPVQNPKNNSARKTTPGPLTSLLLPKLRRATRTALGILPLRLQGLVRSGYKVWPHSRHMRFRANFRKPVPLWSLLFILLLGSMSGIAAYSGLIQIAAESQSQNFPDFTIAAAPVSQSLPQGQLATFDVDLDSLASFAGSVTLGVALTPSAQNSSIALNPVTVSLFTGSATSRLTVSTGPATPTGSYALNVTGTSGRLVRSVAIFLSVTPPPPPDFTLSSSPSSLTITAGSSGFTTILVTSLYGFAGNVTLTAAVSPMIGNRPTVSLNPDQVIVSPGGTQGSTLVVNTVNNTPRITYTVLVVGTSGSISHSLAIALTVQ